MEDTVCLSVAVNRQYDLICSAAESLVLASAFPAAEQGGVPDLVQRLPPAPPAAELLLPLASPKSLPSCHSSRRQVTPLPCGTWQNVSPSSQNTEGLRAIAQRQPLSGRASPPPSHPSSALCARLGWVMDAMSRAELTSSRGLWRGHAWRVDVAGGVCPGHTALRVLNVLRREGDQV